MQDKKQPINLTGLVQEEKVQSPEEKVYLTLRVNKEFRNRLKIEAVNRETTMSQLMEGLFNDYMREQYKSK